MYLSFSPLLLLLAVASVPEVQATLPRVSTSHNSQGQAILVAQASEFVVRGVNYIRLNGSQAAGAAVYHSTFSPVLWNKTEAVGTLSRLHDDGYNAARVFIDTGNWDRDDGVNGVFNSTEPFSKDYMQNLATFVQLATSLDIYVYITLDDLPLNSYWQSKLAPSPYLAGPNKLLMEPSAIEAKSEYVVTFLEALAGLIGQEDLTTVYTVSLGNEVAFDATAMPFTLNTTVTTAAGNYDMSNDTDRQAAADDNMNLWVKQCRVALEKSVAKGVLLTMGMFTFQAVDKTGPNGLRIIASQDPRVPVRPAVLSNQPIGDGVDLLDVHVYQVPVAKGTWSMASDLASSEWSAINFNNTPVIMGEFGAWKENPTLFPTPEGAANAMRKQQTDSCTYNFKGWQFWTVDTWEQPRLWNMFSAPQIFDILSPAKHPSPCH